MRLLSLYYTHKPGGFCKRLYRLLNAAHERGFEVHYLALDLPPPSLGQGVRYHKIPFFLSTRRGLLFWACFTVWCPFFAAWMAVKLRPDRYVVFGAYYSSMLIVARLLNPARSILFLRSLVFKIDAITEKPWIVRTLSAAVERIGIRLASHVVCMTEAMKREVLSLGAKEESISVLPNDLPKINKHELIKSETFIVLTAGVIDQRKNIGFLLDVFELLGQKFSAAQVLLLVAGDGPLLQHYREEALRRNLALVQFLGWMEDLTPLYSKASLVVHPSLHEGMPNAVLEALAYGVPVLTSDTPELCEMMVERELLFGLSKPEDLAVVLEELISSPAKLQHLRELCAKRADAFRFDWEASAMLIIQPV